MGSPNFFAARGVALYPLIGGAVVPMARWLGRDAASVIRYDLTKGTWVRVYERVDAGRPAFRGANS
jgi:hypothetical protein